MTPDELVQRTIENIDSALANFWVLRYATDEGKHEMRAQRQFLLTADAATRQKYLDAYNATA